MSHLSAVAEVLRTTEKNAPARMAALEIGPACGRCGGSGHYSRNYYGQTYCYDCKGRRVRAPRNAKEWAAALTSAQEVAASGRLDGYLEARALDSVVKGAPERVLKAWSESGVSKAYDWNKSYVGSPWYAERDAYVGRTFNGPMCAAWRRTDVAANALRTVSPGAERDAAVVALAGVVAEALEVVRERTEALAAWLAENPA